MGKQKTKPNYRRRVLRLPDLDHCKLAVLNSLGSPASRRVYEYAINQFIAWYCSEPRLAFNRIVVVRYRMYLESRGLAANTINQQLAAVRRLAHEAADSGLLSPELAAGISRVKGVKQLGFRSGNWLSAKQSSDVLQRASGESMRAKRDCAMLAMLFGCGFRRSELVGLDVDDIQMRQGHWAVVDLIGKGGHIRTVPIPQWVKAALHQWTAAAGVTEGRIFRAVARTGKVWGKGISQNVVWYVVRSCCGRAGLEHIAPHDLRRTCAKLCHDSGGELEQIQFLLGHASVQTTERYLGCKQNLGHPVNDLFDLGTKVHPLETDSESAEMKGSTPVEMSSGEEIECRHGGLEHDQPTPTGDPERLSQPARSEVVEVRKGHRPQSVRHCADTGASGSNSAGEADGGQDPAAIGSVGPGRLSDPTPQGDQSQIRIPILASRSSSGGSCTKAGSVKDNCAACGKTS
ncbi:Integrase family protein (modular protein) [Candidatus Sulfotelmatobacter kueseliae]|uniref:Integrase family protein (Modular protein) n=1 Tax=Candidatus Sulfotelmatobacter kueseliae TaxID=2042962 RepID=A0A2U3KCX8_9BACT|nr:Integrase family protein (modular protein) [Candidatus Sulfotelmatobacter kueseliae]